MENIQKSRYHVNMKRHVKNNFDARSIIIKNTQHEKKCRILIDNLKYSVTTSDLSELFNTVGPVKKASIFFKEDGSSTGTGEVIFVRHNDANVAMNKFNNVLLDGRQMKMNLVDERPETLDNVKKEMRSSILGRISFGNRNTGRQPLKTRDTRVFRKPHQAYQGYSDRKNLTCSYPEVASSYRPHTYSYF